MDNELKLAIAEMLKSGNREAVAEMIVEYVQPNHITTDYVGMLLNARSLKPGDSLVKKLRKGISVHTLVPGSIHLANEITVTDRVNYVLDGSDVKVTWNEWEMENGEIGTVGEIRNEMSAKLRDSFQNKVFTALSSVWSAVNTPDNFTSVGGAVTAGALEDAIDRINLTTGGVKAVVGTRTAMTPITKFAAFWSDASGTKTGVSDTAIEEVRNAGLIGRYYGAPLIVVNQIFDNLEDNNAMLPDDKILVIGENVGEFITYGDVKWKQWEDMNPTPPQWFLELYQRFGMIIDKGNAIIRNSKQTDNYMDNIKEYLEQLNKIEISPNQKNIPSVNKETAKPDALTP